MLKQIQMRPLIRRFLHHHNICLWGMIMRWSAVNLSIGGEHWYLACPLTTRGQQKSRSDAVYPSGLMTSRYFQNFKNLFGIGITLILVIAPESLSQILYVVTSKVVLNCTGRIVLLCRKEHWWTWTADGFGLYRRWSKNYRRFDHNRIQRNGKQETKNCNILLFT